MFEEELLLIVGAVAVVVAGWLGFRLGLRRAAEAPGIRPRLPGDSGREAAAQPFETPPGPDEREAADSAVRAAALARVRALEAEADARARRAVAVAMERCAGAVAAERATATVRLASEDLKGRLIGREGRNLRTFERAAGVDLIVEDDACAVTVSTLDPVRREVARRAIEALLAEGRIQPSRIEEVVERERGTLEAELPALGAEAAQRAGVARLAGPVLAALGALKFRASASQNVLEHSVECAHLAALVAAEIGADAAACRRAALLHDIGKGLGPEWEGPHALAGRAFLEAHGEAEPVLHAVGAHHRDIEPISDVASCVLVADAVSGGRPGARRGDVAAMLERVRAMEELARALPGVVDAYAVQAGRDLRVIVRPEQVDDLAAAELAATVAVKLSEHPGFRGPVHVTVIREARFEADAPRPKD